MSLWEGNIVFSDGSPPLKDIALGYPDGSLPDAVSSLSNAGNLQFLSYVDPSRVPLYLAAGPSFYVWSLNSDTSSWFERVLTYRAASTNGLDNENVLEHSFNWNIWEQSSTGVLVRVGDQTHPPPDLPQLHDSKEITEILFYGMNTPDSFLDPDNVHTAVSADGAGAIIRVWALPICSHVLSHIDQIRRKDTEIEARENVSYTASQLDDQGIELSKRQRLTSLFEDAAERRKKARHKKAQETTTGTVEAASRKGLEEKTLASALVATDASSDHGDRAATAQFRRPLSRSPSVSSLQNAPRSSTFRGQAIEGKRSSLQRVSSVMSDSQSTSVNQEKNIETKNKDALSRIIMAGMRIYGLQRKKPGKSRAVSEAPSTTTDGASQIAQLDETDEYKLVYHQTFRGACFTFRAHISMEQLKQEHMQDVVDRLLALFCNDPTIIQPPSVSSERFGDRLLDKSPFAEASGDYYVSREAFHTPRIRRHI